MLNNEVKSKKINFEKASKRAGLLTLVGVIFVVASIIFSYYQLKQMNDELTVKRNESSQLDEEIDEKIKRLKATQEELENTEQVCADFKKFVKEKDPKVAEIALDKTIKENPQTKQVIENIKEVTPTPKITPIQKEKTKQLTKDKVTALKKEREGFQALIAGDYDRAIVAFQEAENAYNSFHNVYELARLLRKNRQNLNDPKKRKEVLKTIVTEYSWKAPPDLLKKVEALANE